MAEAVGPDVVVGPEQWMSLGEDGMQPHMGARFRPGVLHSKLAKSKTKWQSVFTAIMKPECGGLCVLECKRCKNVSPVNRHARCG